MSLIPFDFFADIAIAIGNRRVARASRFQDAAERHIGSGKRWLDIGVWFRGRCSKSLAEIRAEREAKNG